MASSNASDGSLRKFRAIVKNVYFDLDEDRLEFIHRLEDLIETWSGPLPNFRDFVRKEHMDLILADIVRSNSGKELKLVEFIARANYRDEPKIAKTGKPVRRCTTAIHLLGLCSHVALVPKLFQIYDRFDVNYVDGDGFTHLHIATKFDRLDIVQKFLDAGQDLNCVDGLSLESPLHLSIHFQHWRIMVLLLQNGANPKLANKSGLTPLHIICSRRANAFELAELFFAVVDEDDLEVDIDARDGTGRTPLLVAMGYENFKLVELLLRRGADPNSANHKGLSAMHIFAYRTKEDDELETFLEVNDQLQKTVEIDIRDGQSRTPLHVVMECENFHAAELLLRRGADPMLISAKASMPIRTICQEDRHKKLLETFIRAKIRNNRAWRIGQLDEGMYLFRHAVASLAPHIVDVFLDRGFDLAGFVFPTASTFGAYHYTLDFFGNFKYVMVASRAMAVVERLERSKHELVLGDALMIMRYLAEFGIFANDADLANCRRWFADEKFQEKTRSIAVKPGVSILDLIRLKPEQTQERLLSVGWDNYGGPFNVCALPERSWSSCVRYLSEKVTKKFFIEWAQDIVHELWQGRLPIEICIKIISHLRNEELYNICLTA